MKPRNHKKSPAGPHTKRFQTLGLHPGLIRTVDNNRSPCDYHPKKISCMRKPNINNWEPWRIENESQEYSKNLGYEHADLLQLRQFMKGHLGPGSHDIDESIFKQTSASPCLNQNFGKQKRFKKYDIDSPGSARYAVRPYSPKVKHNGMTISRTDRFKLVDYSWSLPCNRYSPKDPQSIDALLRKVVSLRGPYDLFTGKREPENLFNKFSMGRQCSPDKYYSYPSAIENMLHHSSNAMKGKFLKAKRFLPKPCTRNMLNDLSLCYRDPLWPSPVQYIIDSSIIQYEEQLYPFALSGVDARPPEQWKISPGPGRYNIKPSKCMTSGSKNQTSVFASKSKRTEYKAPEYNAF